MPNAVGADSESMATGIRGGIVRDDEGGGTETGYKMETTTGL